MEWLSFEELDASAGELDRLVAVSPDIDLFCSSSAWVLPAHHAFTPEAPPLVGRGESGIAAMMIVPVSGGTRCAVALEASWGLASPFAAADPAALVAEVLAKLRGEPRRVTAIIATGIAAQGAAFEALARGARRSLFPAGPATERIVASLEGGVDGFLSRRSPKLRASLRRAARLAAAAGLTLERRVRFTPDEVGVVLERIFAIERRSWKSVEGGGLTDSAMESFYRLMLPRLAARGALRCVFAVLDGRDVAFCFGGLMSPAAGAAIYRGLQSSYDDTASRVSPGALAHLEMITLLCEEGVAAYDLGSDMPYKRRWGEPGLTTVSCVAMI